jgi:tripartite-type tricarboxylate transporter receptor subunit TctC
LREFADSIGVVSATEGNPEELGYKARLEEAGLRLVGGAPERLGEQIRSESERWAKVVKANNVKVE